MHHIIWLQYLLIKTRTTPFGATRYDKEYDGLDNLDVFFWNYYWVIQQIFETTRQECTSNSDHEYFYNQTHHEGNPNSAIWNNVFGHKRINMYFYLLSSTGSRLLTSMALESGQQLRQGDCKNAFCNGIFLMMKSILWSYQQITQDQRKVLTGNKIKPFTDY